MNEAKDQVVVCTICVEIHGRDTSQAVQCPRCKQIVGCFWHRGYSEHIRYCGRTKRANDGQG